MIFFSYYFNMDPYLWFDEAGQFWISKGLNHDSLPLSLEGNIIDVIKNNQHYNLDPGGFSIILHFWSKVSNHYIWLRTLPFLFFFGTIIGFIYLIYQWTKNRFIALLLGFIPLIIPMLYKEALELRAYSMEVLGCVMCCIAINNLQNKITSKRLLCWSIIISVFLTSRYSFIIVAFVTSTYIIYLIYKTHLSYKQFTSNVIIYATPLFITLGYIYFFAIKHQNPSISTLDYLPYLSYNLGILLKEASLRHLFYLFLIVWLTYKFKKYPIIKAHIGLIYLTCVTNLFFVILSILGLHPWSGDSIRCISMITLVIISFTTILSIILNKISSYIDMRIIILSVICLRLISIQRVEIHTSKHRENALTQYMLLNDIKGKILIDRWESPCMRYQFEYGLLLGDNRYPSQFTIQKFQPHSTLFVESEKKLTLSEWYNNQPKLDYESYDVLIIPEVLRYKSQINKEVWKSINNKDIVWIKK